MLLKRPALHLSALAAISLLPQLIQQLLPDDEPPNFQPPDEPSFGPKVTEVQRAAALTEWKRQRDEYLQGAHTRWLERDGHRETARLLAEELQDDARAIGDDAPASKATVADLFAWLHAAGTAPADASEEPDRIVRRRGICRMLAELTAMLAGCGFWTVPELPSHPFCEVLHQELLGHADPLRVDALFHARRLYYARRGTQHADRLETLGREYRETLGRDLAV